ncbi:hypothetical protein Daus18300_005697 [Diaporthe australafricana]|uniref:BTB domain-containing protein n=1 Tax=Diaporthe australafricana TaxID=127596 RepID=A0ABR3X0I1_9PEZI
MSYAERQEFGLRGDLKIFKFKDQPDVNLVVRDTKIPVHRSHLISRCGRFKQMLNGKEPVGDDGKAVITVESHCVESVNLVLEFIYGASKVELIEYPSNNQPLIQDCMRLYNLGHEFKIPELTKYATDNLGFYLSRRLREFCIYPLSEAKKAVCRNKFIEDLEAGIIKADKSRQAGGDRELPFLMLVDFAVAGRDVLLRDAGLRWDIDQDVVPSSFIKEVMLTLFGPRYRTAWMKSLMVKPEKEARKRRKCAGCDEGIAKEETAAYNPFSGYEFAQRYAQVCCEECAQGMKQGSGVSWEVFDDTKE